MNPRASFRPNTYPGILAFVFGVVVLGAVEGAVAQAPKIRKSQEATVTQKIASTDVKISYSRPVARGRQIWGNVVKWGKTWCPGADSVTTISFSKPVQFAGQPVPAGSYSVWAIPDEKEWTLILSRAIHVWHEPYVDGQDFLRVRVRPAPGPHLETMTYSFPLVDADSAIMRFQWGDVMVSVPLRAP